jgi:IS30 family transposase
MRRLEEERDLLKKAAVGSIGHSNSSDLMALLRRCNAKNWKTRVVCAAEKELWTRWNDGQSLSEIGRALGKHAGSIHTVLSGHSGIAPRERRRRPDALTVAEREEISRSLAAGCTLRSIAARLERSPSTICREVSKNGGAKRYRAASGDESAWQRAPRPKPCKLASNKQLNTVVADRLAKDWLQQQISG